MLYLSGPLITDAKVPRLVPSVSSSKHMSNLEISVIVPTIGRPQSLARLLTSLAHQTRQVDEVIVADGSSDEGTAEVIADPRWATAGLKVQRLPVVPPHAVKQREAAILASKGRLLLLLDDDVELEPNCVAEMVRAIEGSSNIVGVMADFNNQPWSMPTRAWRWYLNLVHRLKDGAWQGRVVGPLLRFGFSPGPNDNRVCEWLGVGNSLIKREAFDLAGGFSTFFLHRSTINEDVDLSLRLARQGTILFCPSARLAHFHDPGGRVSPKQAAEDDLYNRYHILHRTAGRSSAAACGLVLVYAVVESASNILGAARRMHWGGTGQLFRGRCRALWRILRIAITAALGRPQVRRDLGR